MRSRIRMCWRCLRTTATLRGNGRRRSSAHLARSSNVQKGDMSTNFRPLTPTLAADKADEFHDEIQQAIQDLVRRGLVVDSGRRRWSERTGRYEIVWVAREFAHRDQQKKLN
jgi:hypothetical protein